MKIVNKFLFLQKSFIINVRLGSKYASVATKEYTNKQSDVKT